MADRIQIKRTKGWKLRPGTVKVDRTTSFGNPYKVLKCDGGYLIATPKSPAGRGTVYGEKPQAIARCVALFRIYCDAEPTFRELVRTHLRGLNLACWCKPAEPCHADVLLEIANADD